MPTIHVDVHIRKRYLFFIFVLLTLTALQLTYPDIYKFLKPPPPRPINRHATQLTRNLFTNLRLAASSGLTMLGMDEATLQGEFARSGSCGGVNQSKLDGYDSDIRQICADGPGIYGFDFLTILGEWVDTEPYRSDPTFTPDSVHYSRVTTRRLVRSHIRSIHKRGGVSTIHWHMNNPIDEIPVSFDQGIKDQLWQIVPPDACWRHTLLWRAPHCGRAFSRFKLKLNDAVSFLNSLTVEAVPDENALDDMQAKMFDNSTDGIVNDPAYDPKNKTNYKYIPIIVRLFHEQNGHWFWWGVPLDSDINFKSLTFRRWQLAYRLVWKFVIKYHNKHGRNNILWASSPNSDFLTRESYLQYIPPTRELDVLGFDAYGDFKRDYPRTEVRVVVRLAESLGKIPAATELGYNGGDRRSWPADVWSGHVLGPALEERIAWVLMWFNAPKEGECTGTYWGPHINHSNSGDFEKVCDRKDVMMEGEYDYFQTPLNEFNPTLRDNGDRCAESRQHHCKHNGGRGYGRVWVCEKGYFCADETPHSECKCRITESPRADNGLGYCLWNNGCGFGFQWPCSSAGSEAACAKTNDSYTKSCVSYCPNRPECVTNNGRGQTALFPCPENDDAESTVDDHTCSREQLHPVTNESQTTIALDKRSLWDSINVFKSWTSDVGLCIVNDTLPPVAANEIPYCIANEGCGYGDKWGCGFDKQGNPLFCAKSDETFMHVCVAFCPGSCPTPPMPCTGRNGRGDGPLVACEHRAQGAEPGVCVQPNKSGWWEKPKVSEYDESADCECRVYGNPVADNGIPYCLTNKGCGFGWKKRCVKTAMTRRRSGMTRQDTPSDDGGVGDNICAYTDLTMKTPCVSFC